MPDALCRAGRASGCGEILSRWLPAIEYRLVSPCFFYAQVCLFAHLVIIFDVFFPKIRQSLFQELPNGK
jgi:hypothetical protein